MTAESPHAVATFARLAGQWEVAARKAGNVHPERNFADVTYADFVRSAEAAAPEIGRATDRPLGETILAAVRARRAVVRTNTNLGIVLLLAPLAKVPAGTDLRAGVSEVLANTTIEDAARVYEAIRLAAPGGLGKSKQQDVSDAPTLPLRDVMGLAADRDLIARQYATGFADVFDLGVPALLGAFRQIGRVEPAVQHCQLAWLRADGHARNPGTTADLVAACLFVALRERTMTVESSF